MSLATSIGSGTLLNMLARVAFLASGYALQFGLARWLSSAAEYGRFCVLSSLITLARVFLSTGIPQALTQLVAADPVASMGTYRRGLALQLIGAAGVALGFAGLTPALTEIFGDPELERPLLLAAPMIVLLALYQVNLGYVAGRAWFGLQALLTFAYAAAKYALAAAFVLLGWGMDGAVLGLLCSSAIVALWSSAVIPGRKEPARVTTGQLLNLSWPLLVFSFGVSALLNLDLLQLKRYFPASDDVGFYSAAVNLGKAPYFVFYSFSVTALPVLARLHAAGDAERTRRALSRQVRLLALAAFPAAALLAACAAESLELVYGESYAAAAESLVLLSLSTCALSLMVVFASALTACGKPRTSMLLVLICLPTQLLLGMLLIPDGGMLGASISNALATLLGLAAALLGARETIGDALDVRMLGRAALSALGAALLMLALPRASGLWLVLKLGLGFAAYLAALLAAGGLSLRELSGVRRRLLSSGAGCSETNRWS